MWEMKRWLAIFILIILFIVAGFYFKKTPLKTTETNNVLSAVKIPVSTPVVIKQSTALNLEESLIRASWAEVNPKDVGFYSNLTDQHLSEQIKVDNSCQILVNGGFYSKENTHLGLFVSNSETLSKSIQSDTLNGFLWIDNGNIFIKDSLPEVTPQIAVQSGPLLMQDGKPLVLDINNDSPNRRIVAATTADNKLVFLAFYTDESDLDGPLLGLLPEAVSLFKKQTGINIIDAINLDGGSASFFVTNYVILRELAHVGSYFCIK